MSFVVQIDLSLAEKLKMGLLEHNFALENPPPPYTLFQGKKKGVSCTLYESGKLVVQGKEMKEFIEYYLEPEILGTFSYSYQNVDVDLVGRIGVDESGKGDFFGPLCVAALFAEGKSVQKLITLGVKDSKALSDATILKLAPEIEKFPHHLVRIGPEKYNELYSKFGNLNLLLGWGHATVIEYLVEKSGCERVIIDQFAAEHVVEEALKKKKRKVQLFQRTKAEQDVVVAGASILARAAFLRGLKTLEDSAGIKLPKGASKATIEAGKQIFARGGTELLRKVGKIHFKTYSEILRS